MRCLTRSWPRRHGTAPKADRERFYLALDKIVRDAAFDPEEMGDYARATLGIAFDCWRRRSRQCDRPAVTDAWAVRDFLTITGAVKP